MDVAYVNPFIAASSNVIKSMCTLDVKVNKPYVTPIVFDTESLVILIGITGNVRGQVFISFPKKTALIIAGAMMGGVILEDMDEMTESALSELGNMIMGNVATIFSTNKINIDITPPSTARGNMVFDTNNLEHICIPFLIKDNFIYLHIALESAQEKK